MVSGTQRVKEGISLIKGGTFSSTSQSILCCAQYYSQSCGTWCNIVPAQVGDGVADKGYRAVMRAVIQRAFLSTRADTTTLAVQLR